MQLAVDLANASLRRQRRSPGAVYIVVDVDGRHCYRMHGVIGGAVMAPGLFSSEDDLLESLKSRCAVMAEGTVALVLFRNIDTLPYEASLRIRTWRLPSSYPIFVQSSSWEADTLLSDISHETARCLSAEEMVVHVHDRHGLELTALAASRLCDLVSGRVGYVDEYIAHLRGSVAHATGDVVSQMILSGYPVPRNGVVERELNLLTEDALTVLKLVAVLETVPIAWLVRNFSFEAVDQLYKYRWIATTERGETAFVSEFERLVVVETVSPAECLDAAQRMKSPLWSPDMTSGSAVALASTVGVRLDCASVTAAIERLYLAGDFAQVVQLCDRSIKAGILQDASTTACRAKFLILFAAASYATGAVARSSEIASQIDRASLGDDWVDVYDWVSCAGTLTSDDVPSARFPSDRGAHCATGDAFCRFVDACRAFEDGRFSAVSGIVDGARAIAYGAPAACLLPELGAIGARAEVALCHDSSAVRALSESFAGLRFQDSPLWLVSRLEQIAVLISNLYLDAARALVEQTGCEVGDGVRLSWVIESEILDEAMRFLCGEVLPDAAVTFLRNRSSRVACVQAVRAVVLWLATDGELVDDLQALATDPGDDVLASPISVRLCRGFAARGGISGADLPAPASAYGIPSTGDDAQMHLSGSALLACAVSSGYGPDTTAGASETFVKEVARTSALAIGSPSDGRGYLKTVLRRLLSERQVEVVMLAVSGLSNAEVARTLHISTRTAENLLYRAYRVLHLHGREDIVSSLWF